MVKEVSHLHPWQARTQGDPSDALVGTGASGCRVRGCVGYCCLTCKAHIVFWHGPQGWIVPVQLWLEKGFSTIVGIDFQDDSESLL